MTNPIELTPMPAFAMRLIRAVERLRDVGVEPAAIGIPTMPGTKWAAQPSATFYGLPVLWLPSSEDGRVFVVVE